MHDFLFEEVSVELIRPLRTRILRPHFPAGKFAVYEGDDRADTRHFAVKDGSTIVGCATYMNWPSPAHHGEPAMRLRGMAVDAEYQGLGVGRRLLEVSMVRLAVLEPEHDILWCNARVHAIDFYEKLGFVTHGDEFEVAGIGPHVVMWRKLPEALA